MDSCCAVPINEQVLTTMTSASSALGVKFGPTLGQHAHHHLAIDEIFGASEAYKAHLGGDSQPGSREYVFFYRHRLIRTELWARNYRTKGTIGWERSLNNSSIRHCDVGIALPLGTQAPNRVLTFSRRLERARANLIEIKLHRSILRRKRCRLNVSRF